MPDAGDFERHDGQDAAGSGWGAAFAALPQDAPDAGAWQRVQARLPVPAATPVRWPLWLATAAALVLAIAMPLKMLPAPPEVASTTRPTVASKAVPTVVPVESITPIAKTSTLELATPSTPLARKQAERRHVRTPPSQRPIRTAARPAEDTRIAASAGSASAELEPLYARSAQLEGLLALARDERVASGTSAALTDELDARVAGIDTALIQPGLSESQRSDLWNQRVDALQQLVGIEATNRLYAARGQSYDAALVSID